MRMVSLIRAKLRHAGLRVKRVQNLTGTRTLLKVRAEQQRLEEEAERMRLGKSKVVVNCNLYAFYSLFVILVIVFCLLYSKTPQNKSHTNYS